MTVGGLEHRKRLPAHPRYADAAKESVFLDLCELLLMLSERVDGSISSGRTPGCSSTITEDKERKAT